MSTGGISWEWLYVYRVLVISGYILFYCVIIYIFIVAAETAFDWIVITSPEAGSVFLEAWK